MCKEVAVTCFTVLWSKTLVKGREVALLQHLILLLSGILFLNLIEVSRTEYGVRR
jgi:hypothetical protein